jgi:hypothetical protein
MWPYLSYCCFISLLFLASQSSLANFFRQHAVSVLMRSLSKRAEERKQKNLTRHLTYPEPKAKGKVAYQESGSRSYAEYDEGVDLLPPLNLHKSAGKVVLERSEVGKSCLRHYATSFAENRKNARDIFCRRRQKTHATSFVRAAHI